MLDNKGMCRLFGFRSIIYSKVHSSLLHADNALMSQSIRNPDGWGVAFYREDTPHLIKSADRALDDHIFQKVSGVVSSQSVIAHLRKATQGDLSILNSHPFQYGKWVFAHNGNLKNFSEYKEKLLAAIDPDLRPFVLGTTDSEVIFYLLLSEIKRHTSLNKVNIDYKILSDCVESVGKFITQYSGALYLKDDCNPTENHLTFIITNGEAMAAFNGGQDLYFSTHKTKCSERETCPYFANSCENATGSQQKVNHLIFSSEKLVGENIWTLIKKGELIGVDSQMLLYKEELGISFA